MRRFLGLTRAFGGATKRCKKSSLVVSLLSNYLPQCASEAADLPGSAGLLSRLSALTCNTPPTPGRGNVTVFTSFLFCHLPKSKDLTKLGWRLGPVKRSEERRVGKECRSRWSRGHCRRKNKKYGTGRGGIIVFCQVR